MGKRTHDELRIAWEQLTENMRQAGMLELGDIGVDALKHKYLQKITESLRVAIMGKTHHLDGAGNPARECMTWEEVADAVGWELEARGDVKAPKEHLYALTDGTDGGAGAGKGKYGRALGKGEKGGGHGGRRGK